MSVHIHKIPGEMPATWERQAIFFANLVSLFYGNEEETDVLRQEVGTLETYGGRMVPLLDLIYRGGGNLLVLEKKPDETLLNYFRDIGLTLPEINVLSHKLYCSLSQEKPDSIEARSFCDKLVSLSASWIDGYVTDAVLDALAQKLKKKTTASGAGSRRGNNKLLLHEFLISSGFPVFDTLVADDPDEVPACLLKLKEKGYSAAVIKSQIGASGIGMVKMNLDQANPEKSCPEYLFFEGPCLVQGWLDGSVEGVEYIGSPSVQMFIKDEDISLYDITEQILSKDSVHEGNIAPPAYLKESGIQDELLGQTEAVSLWLHAQGYRGTASADCHVIRHSGTYEVRVCEVNARVTGATYPALLARHFYPQGAWVMRNMRFDPPLKSGAVLKILNDAGILFYPQEKTGIIPFNFNPDDSGDIVKGQFLFIGATSQDALSLLKKMSELPHIKGGYDRD